jgi:hypothetical protein
MDYNTALIEYEEAALLLGGDRTSSLPGLVNIQEANTELVTAYQFALYDIFTSTSTMAYWGNGLDPTAGGLAEPLLAQAQNDIASSTDYSATYSQLRIYTPTDQTKCDQGLFYFCGQHSEFLQFNTTATPEPCTRWLLGLTLLSVLIARYPIAGGGLTIRRGMPSCPTRTQARELETRRGLEYPRWRGTVGQPT